MRLAIATLSIAISFSSIHLHFLSPFPTYVGKSISDAGGVLIEMRKGIQACEMYVRVDGWNPISTQPVNNWRRTEEI